MKARHIISAFIGAALFWMTSAAAAQAPRDLVPAEQTRPKIGLVLGGGGARGLAHVGVISLLEEHRIPIDVVSGTSMGAVVGALYASGYSSAEIKDIAENLDWGNVFNDRSARAGSPFRAKTNEFGFLTDYRITFKNGQLVLPEGIIQGQRLFLELSKLLAPARGTDNFDALPIPFRIAATDLETGGPVILTSGDLASAVFGSMAIPGFVPPVERDGTYLIDGGLVNNVPVDLARALGADIVIVVNVGGAPNRAEDITNFVDVLRQTQILLTQNNTIAQLATLKPQDVLIEPVLDGVSITDFDQARSIVAAGADALRPIIPRISAAFSLSPAQWRAHLAQRKRRSQSDSPMIDAIKISQNGKLADDVLRAQLRVKPGTVLDTELLNADINKIYAGGLFRRIDYEVETIGDKTVLHIQADSNVSSDGFFRFGIALDSNLESQSQFRLGLSYTRPNMNAWGGEWRSEAQLGDTVNLSSEFHQPLGAHQKFFVEPAVQFVRQKRDFFLPNDQRLGTVTTLGYGAGVAGGLTLGRWGELRGGVQRVKTEVSFSDSSLQAAGTDFDETALTARFSIDTLDNLSFPTSGTLLVADVGYFDEFLGGETAYNQVSIAAYKPFTFGRHTLGANFSLSGAAGRDSAIFGDSALGGFLSLSGFSEDELSGQYAALVAGTYYYRLNRRSALFDVPIYAGGSLEIGNVYQDFGDIGPRDAIIAGSLFAGLRTPIGPIYLGVGSNDKGNTSLYFTVGSFF